MCNRCTLSVTENKLLAVFSGGSERPRVRKFQGANGLGSEKSSSRPMHLMSASWFVSEMSVFLSNIQTNNLLLNETETVWKCNTLSYMIMTNNCYLLLTIRTYYGCKYYLTTNIYALFVYVHAPDVINIITKSHFGPSDRRWHFGPFYKC